MPRVHRQTFKYWFQAFFVGGFWLFAIMIAGFILSMSLTGRIDGGVMPNVFTTVFVLIWIGTVSSFAAAYWTARNLESRTNLVALARRPQPTEPVAARTWRYTRVAWYGWLSVALLIGLP